MREQEIISAGVLLVVVGIVVIMLGMLSQGIKGKDADIRGAGVVMIGPIPIVFGTDAGSVKTVMVMALALIAASYFLFKR